MELLANKIRPKKLEEIIGQQHLVGENKVLSNLVKSGKIFSMILYGKPGIGKTSIANALISGEISYGETITFDLRNNELVIR